MTSTTPSPHFRFSRYRRLLTGLGIVAGLIVLLGALAYFWLPGYAKSQLEFHLSRLLQREVTIAAIEIKPHTLELTVSGFQIADKDHTDKNPHTFIAFSRLHLDLSFQSFRHLAPVVTSVTLEEPRLRLLRETENTFNFSDILEAFNQPDRDENATQSKFSVTNLTIRNGLLEFEDRFAHTDHQISEINLHIPLVSNVGNNQNGQIEPNLAGSLNGAPFSLNGKLQVFNAPPEADFTVKLDQFDLTRVTRYAALPHGITLLSGQLHGELQIKLAQTDGETVNVAITGNTALRQISIANTAVAAPYRADIQQIEVMLSSVHWPNQQPLQMKLGMDRIALTRTDAQQPVITLDKLRLGSIAVNMTKHELVVADLNIDRLHAAMQRGADGEIDLAGLFNPTENTAAIHTNAQEIRRTTAQPWHITANRIPVPGKKPGLSVTTTAAQPSQAQQPAATNAPWATRFKRINLKSASFHYQDLTLKKPAPMNIDGLNVTIDAVDLHDTKPSHLTLQAQVNQKGKINANGILAWQPFSTELAIHLDAVDIVSLQGWVGDKLAALLTSGDISFDGNIKLSGQPAGIRINGQGKLANFNLLDANNSQDLLRWKNLEINNLNFTDQPLRIAINTVKLQDYFARLTILPDGNLNLKQIVRHDQAPSVDAAAVTEPRTAGQGAQKEKALPIFIDKVVLQHGNINFRDRFIKPSYRANLTGLSGQIGPLHPGQSGKIDIVGALDKTAPLQIKGDVDLFGTELSLDLTAKIKDIDLPPLSPYSGKYVGYEIEKGKLSADVFYRVQKGVLTADNKIFLDQFTLGKEVAGEDKTSLPLNLAITLLKNRHGEIDIHLPLQGSLDDPEFNLGDIIFTAIVNLISKAITSPFALIGAVLDKGEELSEITFIPGYFHIESESAERLRMLAEVLDDRPALKLEIIGHYNQNLDRDGLKLAILQNKVKTQKLADDADRGIASGALEDITLSRKDYDKYLAIAYQKENFDKPRNAIGLSKTLPGDEMERLMLTHTVVNDADLKALAENRAIAARNWLIENGNVSSERIFVVGVHADNDDAQKQGSRVEFILK
ncbi:MAG: DUF748 domain-containing protein [Nitrosomonas sp.]|nr:MAG: DUF748 domain-containing protein [Nitrosomonas sp.]